jgi:hypothetical protein
MLGQWLGIHQAGRKLGAEGQVTAYLICNLHFAITNLQFPNPNCKLPSSVVAAAHLACRGAYLLKANARFVDQTLRLSAAPPPALQSPTNARPMAPDSSSWPEIGSGGQVTALLICNLQFPNPNYKLTSSVVAAARIFVVPEPSSVGLLLLSTLAMAAHWCREHRRRASHR